MADLKITDLTAVETPADTDLIETVQDVPTTPINKKITWTVIKTFLKSYFDDIYEAILPTEPTSPATKFLNGLRQWAEISIGSGGYSANIYPSNIDSDVSGYKTLSYDLDASESVRSIVVNNNTVTGETCLYGAGIGVTIIPAGVWKANFYAKADSTIGDTILKAQVFVRHTDNSETDLFEFQSPTIENTADYALLRFNDSSQNAFTVLATDRLGIRIKGATTRTSNTTINYIVGDGRGAYFTTPLQIRHSQLRDLNGDNSYLHVTSTEKSTWNAKVSLTGTETLTNKRITKRITALTSHATPTINTDNCDCVDITALAENITNMSTNLSGTPTNKQELLFQIKDNGTARTIAWGTSFVAGGVALPITTVASKILTVKFVYNTANSLNKWMCVAYTQEA